MSIKNVLNYRKPAFWIAAAILVIAVTIFAVVQLTHSTFRSNSYHVSLRYPSEWKLAAGYNQRFEGKDGFFQVAAVEGKDMTIDEAAAQDANPGIKPYGSEPRITYTEIDGQEGRLIMPSSDQKGMKNQAGLIVKYPQPVKIGNTVYNYFILWADKNHIEAIGKTISFK